MKTGNPASTPLPLALGLSLGIGGALCALLWLGGGLWFGGGLAPRDPPPTSDPYEPEPDDPAVSAQSLVQSKPFSNRTTLPRAAEGGNAAPIDENLAGAANKRKTEKQLYAGFLALAKAEPAAFRVEAERIFDPATQQSTRIAVLRAICDTSIPGRTDLLLRAIRGLPNSTAHGLESAPSVLVKLLTERARGDTETRQVLELASFESGGALDPHLRRRCIAALAASATGEQLVRFGARLAAETDPLLVAGAVSALASNPDAAAAFVLHQIPQAPETRQEGEGRLDW